MKIVLKKYFNRWLKKTLPRWSWPRGVVNYWKFNSLDSRACLWLQQTSRSCVMIPAISLRYRSTRQQSFRSVHLNAATWNSCSWKNELFWVNFDSLMALCQRRSLIEMNFQRQSSDSNFFFRTIIQSFGARESLWAFDRHPSQSFFA